MTQKEIQLLVEGSYTKDQLDEKKVEKIAKLLKRKDLKAYIRGLKLADKKHKVYIAMPTKSVYNTERKRLEEVFDKKELIFEESPALLLGMKILDEDTEYDMSLQNQLTQMVDAVEEHYNE